MGAGRKPVPPELKILRGNPGKRDIPRNLPKSRGKAPRCPSDLHGIYARREWRRMTREFEALRVLDPADRAALEIYCRSYALWRIAEWMVRRTGMVTRAASGYSQVAAYMAIYKQLSAQLKSMLTEFGGTPSSRVKVRVQHESKEPNLADKLKAAVNGE